MRYCIYVLAVKLQTSEFLDFITPATHQNTVTSSYSPLRPMLAGYSPSPSVGHRRSTLKHSERPVSRSSPIRRMASPTVTTPKPSDDQQFPWEQLASPASKVGESERWKPRATSLSCALVGCPVGGGRPHRTGCTAGVHRPLPAAVLRRDDAERVGF